MALPRTRKELTDWCLRELGSPVIEINVDEDQVEDRVDESLAYFRDYHFDGLEHAYYNHKVTATKLTFSGISGTFKNGDIISGSVTKAKGLVLDQAADNLSIRSRLIGDSIQFAIGDVITSPSGAIGIATAVLVGDLDNKYITLPDSVIAVTDIIPFNHGYSSSSTMFDVRYQFALNDMYNLLSTDIVSYWMFKDNIALWNYVFDGKKSLHYNRVTERLYIDADWTNAIHADMYLIVDGWMAVDPQAYVGVYSNLFVRKYTTALIKRQWGTNLKLFEKLELPGGLTLNGQVIFDEAEQEIERLEKRIQQEWQFPPDFFLG